MLSEADRNLGDGDHGLGILAAQRHDIDRREFQIRAHAHRGNGHDMLFEHGIDNFTT